MLTLVVARQLWHLALWPCSSSSREAFSADSECPALASVCLVRSLAPSSSRRSRRLSHSSSRTRPCAPPGNVAAQGRFFFVCECVYCGGYGGVVLAVGLAYLLLLVVVLLLLVVVVVLCSDTVVAVAVGVGGDVYAFGSVGAVVRGH